MRIKDTVSFDWFGTTHEGQLSALPSELGPNLVEVTIARRPGEHRVYVVDGNDVRLVERSTEAWPNRPRPVTAASTPSTAASPLVASATDLLERTRAARRALGLAPVEEVAS